jgi:hypothetical protein
VLWICFGIATYHSAIAIYLRRKQKLGASTGREERIAKAVVKVLLSVVVAAIAIAALVLYPEWM